VRRGRYKERVKEGEYGGNIYTCVNRIQTPVDTIPGIGDGGHKGK
jgi:hypothetical protein